MFGRIDGSRRMLDARPTRPARSVRRRARRRRVEDSSPAQVNLGPEGQFVDGQRFAVPQRPWRPGSDAMRPDAAVELRRGYLSAVTFMDSQLGPGQDKGDSTSLQRGCSARARSGKSIHASRRFREMIARPKISQNEWETAEI